MKLSEEILCFQNQIEVNAEIVSKETIFQGQFPQKELDVFRFPSNLN